MNIIIRNTVVLNSSFQFNPDKTEITYQANTELVVEGNPHEDLFTPRTIFNLKCKTSKIANIQSITEDQVRQKINELYNV